MRYAKFTSIMGLCLLIGACGHTSHNGPTSSASGSTTTPDPSAQLEGAARSALQLNVQLSAYVLWHNTIPAWAARSTAGPALDGMRRSAAQRASGDVRVRVLSSGVEVRALRLDPSYLSASAKVVELSRVIPYRRGHRIARATTLTEPALVVLHRADHRRTFVVWKLEAAK